MVRDRELHVGSLLRKVNKRQKELVMLITKTGTVTISNGTVRVQGFEFDGAGDNEASCRKGVMLATLWALMQAQEQLYQSLEIPWGGGNIIQSD